MLLELSDSTVYFYLCSELINILYFFSKLLLTNLFLFDIIISTKTNEAVLKFNISIKRNTILYLVGQSSSVPSGY